MDRLYKFDPAGKILIKHEINETLAESLTENQLFLSGDPFIVQNDNGLSIVIPTISKSLFLYDTAFHFIRKLSPGISFGWTIFLDVDGDGHDEILTQSSGKNQFGIFRSDLSNPVILDIPVPFAQPHQTRISIIHSKGKPTLLFINSGEMQYTISYMRNPFYYLKWTLYLGIYCAILLFTLLVARIQMTAPASF